MLKNVEPIFSYTLIRKMSMSCL